MGDTQAEADEAPPASPTQIQGLLKSKFGSDADGHGREIGYIARYAMERGGIASLDELDSWLDRQMLLLQRNDPLPKNARWPQGPLVVRLAKMLARAEGTRSTLGLHL